MKRELGLVVLVACLAGCAPKRVPRQPPVRVDLPEVWTAPAVVDPGTPGGQWWQSFGDPHLEALIGIALQDNLELEAAVARLDGAAAAARIETADLYPSVSAGASYARDKQSLIGLPLNFGPPRAGGPPTSFTTTRYGVSLDTSWEIDLWGRVRAGRRSALAAFQASRADLRGARLSLAGQTAKSWLAILEARQQVQLARRSAGSFSESADLVRSRFEVGIRPAVDLRLALSNLATAEALVQVRLAQLDNATRMLEVLLGRYPNASLLDEYPPTELPAALRQVPVGLPADLIARRPDLAAAERRLAAADARYRQARRSLYPRLVLTASGGNVSSELSTLLEGDSAVWGLLAGITAPVFQGGRLRAEARRADAAGREALALYAGAALSAFAEVESALAREQFLARREVHLAEASEQLSQARRLAEERYESGVGIYLTVLESQSRALTAESELISLRRERLSNRVDLHLALGGGFETSGSGSAQTATEVAP